MWVDLECVESFVALVRHEHFSRAACALHVSTSALSKRLARLERHVGEVLVMRGPHGYVGLTPSGEAFRITAERLLAEARASRAESGPSMLRLGVPGRASDSLSEASFRVIGACLARTVGARLVVRGVPYGADDQWLLEGRIDVMLGMVEPLRPGLRQAALMQSGRVVALAPTNPLAEAQVAHVDDLQELRVVTTPYPHKQWMAPWCLGDVDPVPEGRLLSVEARGTAELIPRIIADQACGVISDAFGPTLRERLAVLPLIDAPPLLTRATYRADDARPSVSALIDVLQALAAVAPPR